MSELAGIAVEFCIEWKLNECMNAANSVFIAHAGNESMAGVIAAAQAVKAACENVLSRPTEENMTAAGVAADACERACLPMADLECQLLAAACESVEDACGFEADEAAEELLATLPDQDLVLLGTSCHLDGGDEEMDYLDLEGDDDIEALSLEDGDLQIEDEATGDSEDDDEEEKGGHENDAEMQDKGERENMSRTPARASIVSLRSANLFGAAKPTVEREGKGAIRNVSIMQAGPATGHGFLIDQTMLRQVARQMEAGVPMRFRHPEISAPDGSRVPVDPLGTHVGRIANVKQDADGTVRGDILFGAHAKNVPALGNVAQYLMDLADEDPSSFGLSVAFAPAEYDRDPSTGTPIGRSAGVAACDLTGDPAANRDGLC